MASRGGAGVGVIVTMTILGIVSLGLFISTIVFYGNYNKVKTQNDSAQQTLKSYIRDQERQDPQITLLADAARKDSKSLVGYLHDSLSKAMRTIEGSDRGTFDDLMQRLQSVKLPSIARATGWDGNDADAPPLSELVTGSPMKGLLTSSNQFIDQLEDQKQAALKAKTVAQEDLANELAKSKAREEAHKATLAAINEELARYRNEVEAYRQGVQQHETDMDSRVARIQQDFASKESQYLDRINALEEESSRLRNQLDVLRGERKNDLFQGQPEESLVDGHVIAIDAADGTAMIDLGKGDKIRVGLTFAVYAEPSAIRADENGDYPRGKATLEIIRIDDDTSICRVIGERSGNPVVRGDVIANAVYDPNKTYKFLLVGNFDANRDGVATEAEQAGIAAMVQGWGGTVTDDLTGDVDFLVMGQRPTLPPEPPIDAPIAIVEQFVQAQQIISRYDKLFDQASSTSIPVLNENRLRTLIGQ